MKPHASSSPARLNVRGSRQILREPRPAENREPAVAKSPREAAAPYACPCPHLPCVSTLYGVVVSLVVNHLN
jgi:hypothetical protein